MGNIIQRSLSGLKVVLFFCIISGSCKTTSAKKNMDTQPQVVDNPANSCFITGKILSVRKADENAGVIAKAPDVAMVLIKSISGCGKGATAVLNAGDSIEINFVFTLSDTKTVNPSMNPSLPGMIQGTDFTASMEERLSLGDKYFFRVYYYKVQ